MQDSLKRAWMALHRIPHLTDTVLRCLIKAKGDPGLIMAMSPQELTRLGVPAESQRALTSARTTVNKAHSQKLDNDWGIIDSLGVEIVPLSSEHYPELLKQISDPPPILYVRGKLALLERPQLAIVGSRKPSPQGCENAFRFARELAMAGFTVTSGMALGIDTYSHQGALDATGDTIAVLGTGIDRVYPAQNRRLLHAIINCGTVISEFWPGSGPKHHHFPKRNRIISGLSLGVLVVEAAIQSGSLISARCALEQGREVFAIPGSIHNPASRGCHALINQGARLVETASDILEELAAWRASAPVQVDDLLQAAPSAELDCAEKALLDMLGHDPASIDVLQQRSGWPVAVVSARLTTLEIKGLVENIAGIFQRIG